MNPVLLLVNALAAYRLTLLLQVDELPPLPELRERLYRAQRKAADDSWRGRLIQEVAFGFNCPWCLSFWVSAGVVALNAFFPALWRPLATSLALSAVVGHLRTKLD